MLLPRSAALVDLIVLDSTPSTNDELLARAPGSAEFSTVVTTDQTAGRGRLGREWIAPPGETLAASVLLHPRSTAGPLERDRWGWIPLLAGVAMARTVQRLLPDRDVSLKWPNDVLVGGRKISGILAELLPDGSGLVLGAGLNVAIPEDRLPTPTSTSLAIEGVESAGDELVDAALSAWLGELMPLYTELLHGGDAGIRSSVTALCSTIGQRVKVQLPGSGGVLVGTAVGLDETGRILVERESDGGTQAVAAGDVTHLRYE